MQRFILGWLLLFASGIALAESPVYLDLGAGRTAVETGDKEFTPWIARVKLGYAIDVSNAVELHYATNYESDTVDGIEMELEEASGIYYRYTTLSDYNGVRMYFLLGQAYTTLSSTAVNVDGKELEDFSWAIGLKEASTSFPGMVYSLEYIELYEDDNVELKAYMLGFQFTY